MMIITYPMLACYVLSLLIEDNRATFFSLEFCSPWHMFNMYMIAYSIVCCKTIFVVAPLVYNMQWSQVDFAIFILDKTGLEIICHTHHQKLIWTQGSGWYQHVNSCQLLHIKWLICVTYAIHIYTVCDHYLWYNALFYRYSMPNG